MNTQKIESYKKAVKNVKSKNVGMKFQSVVHRSLYASLKQKLNQIELQPKDDVIIDNMHRFEKIIKDQTEEIMALRKEIDSERENKESIQQKYSHLMKTHQELERNWNSQMDAICKMEKLKQPMQEINMKNVGNCQVFKTAHSAQANKENIGLKKRTFIDHDRKEYSLKSRVIELLNEHAPSEEIKEILKEVKNKKVNVQLQAHEIDSENENENAEKDEIIQILRNENEKMEQKFKSVESDKNQLENAIITATQHAEKLIGKQDELEQEREVLLSRIHNLQQAGIQADGSLQAASEFIENLQKQTAANVLEQTAQMKKLQNKLQTKEKMLNEFLVENDQNIEACKRLRQENDALDSELHRVHDLNETLQEAVHHLRGQMHKIENEMNAKDELIEMLKDEKLDYDGLKKRYSVMMQQFVTMTKLNESLQCENSQLMDAQIVADDKCQNLSIKLNELQTKNGQLAQSLFNRITIAACYKMKCEDKMEKLNKNHENELTNLHSMLDKLSEEFNSLKSSQSGSPQNELVCVSDDVQSKLVHLEFQSIVHQQLSAKIQQTHNKLQTKYDAKMKKYKTKIAELRSQCNEYLQSLNENEEKLKHFTNVTELYEAATESLKQSNERCKTLSDEKEIMQNMINNLNASIITEEKDLKSVTNSYEDLLQKIVPMQDENKELKAQHKELKAEYDLLSKAYQEIREEYEAHKKDVKMYIISLKRQREIAQTDLTVESLKTMQLNDELEQIKENAQSNRTGLMLESMEAKDTIHQLLEENSNLKTKLLTDQIELIKQTQKKTQTDIEYCNDPSHEEQISSLQRKFGLMCLNVEKVQLESFEFVQKAMTLREANKALKKENRKISRELKKIQADYDDLKTKSDAQWSLNTSCRESVASNHGIYYDEAGNAMNLDELKLILDNYYLQMNDEQKIIATNSEKVMDKMIVRLNDCIDAMREISSKRMRCVDENKQSKIQEAIMQIADFSEITMNEMSHQFDARFSLYEMRCDGVSRNIRLIKHALDSKQNDENQQKLNKQNLIESGLYDLQFKMKILNETFRNKEATMIKHDIGIYREEFEHFEATMTKTFKITMEKYNELLKDKNEKIQELECLLCEKKDKYKTKIEMTKSNLEELQQMNGKLEQELAAKDSINVSLALKNEQMIEMMETLKNEKEQNEKEKSDDLQDQIKGFEQKISELETKLNLYEFEKNANKNSRKEKEEKMKKLVVELAKTKEQRDKYFGDKQLLQREMKMVNKQLDELDGSKSQLLKQIEQMMAFQNNTVALKEKMEEYSKMTVCNQQKIQQLESMKSVLEKDNITQSERIQKVFAENEEFKKENEAQRDMINDLKAQKIKLQELMNDRNEKHLEAVNDLHSIIENQNSQLLRLEEDQQIIFVNTTKDNEQHSAAENELSALIETQKKELFRAHDQNKEMKVKCDELQSQNATQHAEISELKAINASLHEEISSCDTQIGKLKQCIMQKLSQVNAKYNGKVSELKESKALIEKLSSKQSDYLSDIQLCKIEIIEKDELIKELEANMENERATINYKLDMLKVAMENKLRSVSQFMQHKERELKDIRCICMHQNDEIYQMKTMRDRYMAEMSMEIDAKMQYQDENAMLMNYKGKLEEEVQELNQSINATHSKQRMFKQVLDETVKSNKSLTETVKNLKDQALNLQQQLAFTKHENEQINRHRTHVKEKCDELQSRLTRYKEKYKNVCEECTQLRKKASVLDQLLRLSENEIHSLEFDKKSSQVREQMLTELFEKANEENMASLYEAYEALKSSVDNKQQQSEHENEDIESLMNCNFMQQRIEELKTECDRYKVIIATHNQNTLDLKQQSALKTHKILEHWSKIFDKLMSMINIKSYTIEILQKTVNDIIEINNQHKSTDFEHENKAMHKNIDEMKETVRKLESKHKKEKIELKGLLDREVHLAHSQRDCMEKELHVYREKLQSFYTKYRRSKEQKEQEKLAKFMDDMRHEMSQITQENVTMATVTNSLREIVREHQDKTIELQSKNASMYTDIHELCQYMQQISGECFLSEDEESMYNAESVSEMVSAVKQKALSISSSRSSLHNNDEDEYAIIDHEDHQNGNEEEQEVKIDNKECPVCEQSFNTMVWKYKCTACNKHHCSICAPIRDQTESGQKARICHTCYPK